MSNPHILVTDLDGTFIPLSQDADNQDALAQFREVFRTQSKTLVFATGRHLASVEEAIEDFDLPTPSWIIADVGVSIFRMESGRAIPIVEYEEFLKTETNGTRPSDLQSMFAKIPDLQLQPGISQSMFKLSYLCDPKDLSRLTTSMEALIRQKGFNLACTSSVDPIGEVGLIDVLPRAASKHAALRWLTQFVPFKIDSVVYAGDSGNDRPALTGDFRSILVGNADPSLRQNVVAEVLQKGRRERLYCASASATSGVLEGCRHFGMI